MDKIYNINGKKYYKKDDKYWKINKYIKTDRYHNTIPIYLYNGIEYLRFNNKFKKFTLGGAGENTPNQLYNDFMKLQSIIDGTSVPNTDSYTINVLNTFSKQYYEESDTVIHLEIHYKKNDGYIDIYFYSVLKNIQIRHSSNSNIEPIYTQISFNDLFLSRTGTDTNEQSMSYFLFYIRCFILIGILLNKKYDINNLDILQFINIIKETHDIHNSKTAYGNETLQHLDKYITDVFIRKTNTATLPPSKESLFSQYKKKKNGQSKNSTNIESQISQLYNLNSKSQIVLSKIIIYFYILHYIFVTTTIFIDNKSYTKYKKLSNYFIELVIHHYKNMEHTSKGINKYLTDSITLCIENDDDSFSYKPDELRDYSQNILESIFDTKTDKLQTNFNKLRDKYIKSKSSSDPSPKQYFEVEDNITTIENIQQEIEKLKIRKNELQRVLTNNEYNTSHLSSGSEQLKDGIKTLQTLKSTGDISTINSKISAQLGRLRNDVKSEIEAINKQIKSKKDKIRKKVQLSIIDYFTLCHNIFSYQKKELTLPSLTLKKQPELSLNMPDLNKAKELSLNMPELTKAKEITLDIPELKQAKIELDPSNHGPGHGNGHGNGNGNGHGNGNDSKELPLDMPDLTKAKELSLNMPDLTKAKELPLDMPDLTKAKELPLDMPHLITTTETPPTSLPRPPTSRDTQITLFYLNKKPLSSSSECDKDIIKYIMEKIVNYTLIKREFLKKHLLTYCTYITYITKEFKDLNNNFYLIDKELEYLENYFNEHKHSLCKNYLQKHITELNEYVRNYYYDKSNVIINMSMFIEKFKEIIDSCKECNGVYNEYYDYLFTHFKIYYDEPPTYKYIQNIDSYLRKVFNLNVKSDFNTGYQTGKELYDNSKTLTFSITNQEKKKYDKKIFTEKLKEFKNKLDSLIKVKEVTKNDLTWLINHLEEIIDFTDIEKHKASRLILYLYIKYININTDIDNNIKEILETYLNPTIQLSYKEEHTGGFNELSDSDIDSIFYTETDVDSIFETDSMLNSDSESDISTS